MKKATLSLSLCAIDTLAEQPNQIFYLNISISDFWSFETICFIQGLLNSLRELFVYFE